MRTVRRGGHAHPPGRPSSAPEVTTAEPAVPRSARGERGFALLLVLWTLVLLSLIVTRIAASGRAEVQRAANLRDAAIVQAAADGAVQDAVFHVLAAEGDQRWIPSGRHRLTMPGEVTVEVGIEDLAGRVNPNLASPKLLRALLEALGVDAQRAAALADAIVDWRTPRRNARPHGAKAPEYRAAGRDYGPPGEPFRDLDEFGAVLGVTPELLALLRPHLTLWWDDDPDPAAAGPAVLAALRATGDDVGAASSGGGEERSGVVLVVSITAEATGPHGSRFRRYAAVEITPPGRRVSAGGGGGVGSRRLLDWGTTPG